ncbi:MAG: hypothetical protein ABIM89_19025 [Mycobacteriales bacterium]
MMSEHSTSGPGGTPVMSPAPADAPPPPPGYLPLQFDATPIAVQQHVSTQVMPSLSATHRRSLGGRASVVGVVLALLLGSAGAAFGTGKFKNDKEPGPAAQITAVTPAAPVTASAAPTAPNPVAPARAAAPAKPLARKPTPTKPVIKPTRLEVTRANSRTLGRAYSMTLPAGWVVKLKIGRFPVVNGDVELRSNGPANDLVWFDSYTLDYAPPGPLTRAKFDRIRARMVKTAVGIDKTTRVKVGTIKMVVDGRASFAFDTTSDVRGTPYTERTVIFQNGSRIYAATWSAKTAEFVRATPVFEGLMASVKFAS